MDLQTLTHRLVFLSCLCALSTWTNAEVINESPEVAGEPSVIEAVASINPENLREMPITDGVDLDPLVEQRMTAYRGADFLPVESNPALAQEPSQLSDPLYTAPKAEVSDAAPLAIASATKSWNSTGQLVSFLLLSAGLLTLLFARFRLGAPLRALEAELDAQDQPSAA